MGSLSRCKTDDRSDEPEDALVQAFRLLRCLTCVGHQDLLNQQVHCFLKHFLLVRLLDPGVDEEVRDCGALAQQVHVINLHQNACHARVPEIPTAKDAAYVEPSAAND